MLALVAQQRARLQTRPSTVCPLADYNSTLISLLKYINEAESWHLFALSHSTSIMLSLPPIHELKVNGGEVCRLCVCRVWLLFAWSRR